MNNKYYGFVYITTNLVNNKKYIGMHTKFNDNYLGSGILLNKAIKKYGKSNFSRKIIAYAKTKEELANLEKKYIKMYNAVDDDNFYNIHEGGYGIETKSNQKIINKIKSKQLKHWKNISDKDREKFKITMSNAVRGEKNPNYGNYWSEEKKQQLSKLRIENGKTKGELNGMFGKKGDNAINGKKVYMYDEDFKLLKTFNTVGLVLDYLNLKGHSQLNKSIKNKTLYKGYYWSKELI